MDKSKRDFIIKAAKISGLGIIACAVSLGFSIDEALAAFGVDQVSGPAGVDNVTSPAGVDQVEGGEYTCLDTIVESFTNTGSARLLRYDTARTALAQTFLTTEGGNRCSVLLNAKRNGSWSVGVYNIWVELWDTSGGAPNSQLYVSDYVDVYSLTGSYTDITFTFPDKPAVSNATTYALFIIGDFPISTANYVSVNAFTAYDDYADGSAYYYNGSVFTIQTGHDIYFKVRK